jgi:hypothetical protein
MGDGASLSPMTFRRWCRAREPGGIPDRSEAAEPLADHCACSAPQRSSPLPPATIWGASDAAVRDSWRESRRRRTSRPLAIVEQTIFGRKRALDGPVHRPARPEVGNSDPVREENDVIVNGKHAALIALWQATPDYRRPLPLSTRRLPVDLGPVATRLSSALVPRPALSLRQRLLRSP